MDSNYGPLLTTQVQGGSEDRMSARQHALI